MKIPPAVRYLTCDTVAECLDYQKHLNHEEGEELYCTLWGFLDAAKNPTPVGGDGSEGTVEHPCGRLDLANDDKAPHWWIRLTWRQQRAITLALAE